MRHYGIDIRRCAYKYIKDSTRALAIEVINPTLYRHPIALGEIRGIIPRWFLHIIMSG